MTRAHRSAHPFIWIAVAVVVALSVWFGLKAQPEPARATLPDAAAAAIEEQG